MLETEASHQELLLRVTDMAFPAPVPRLRLP